jgi:hypothetical protein
MADPGRPQTSVAVGGALNPHRRTRNLLFLVTAILGALVAVLLGSTIAWIARLSEESIWQVWAAPLSDGSVACLLFNR